MDKTTTITGTSPKGAKAKDALMNSIDINQENGNKKQLSKLSINQILKQQLNQSY